MNTLFVAILRGLVILIGLGVVFVQVRVVPIIASGLVNDADVPDLAIPYAIGGITLAACIEVVLVALWALLSMVRGDAIFTSRAFRWVDLIIGAAIAGTAISVVVALHVALVVEPPLDAPGLTVIAGGVAACWAAFTLLMVVMRGLLRSATALRSELAEVV